MDNNLYLSFGSSTQTGSSKEFNTDALVDFEIPEGHVFVVCDGHDGVNGHGALASKMIAESIKKYFFNRTYKEMAAALANAVVYANFALYDLTLKDTKYQGIGSTLAILIYRDGKVYYAYAGDSRIYWLRNGNLQLLTRDHHANNTDTTTAEVNVLLGKNKDIRFGVCKNPLNVEPGDLFLLCTDGLTDVIDDNELLFLLSEQNNSAEHKSLHLLEKVKNSHGKGDASLQVIEFNQAFEKNGAKRPVNFKPVIIVGLIVLFLAAFSYVGYRLYPDFISQDKLSETVQGVGSETDDEETAETIRNESAQENEVSYPDEISENSGDASKESAKQKNTVVPAEKKVAPAKEEKQKAKPGKEDNTGKNKQEGIYIHTIQAGENLYRLGLRYHVPQQKIIDLNGATATKLVTGQKLKIPITAIHKVAAGETLKTLSTKYKVKVNDIKSANKMEEVKTLVLGQEIIIPLP